MSLYVSDGVIGWGIYDDLLMASLPVEFCMPDCNAPNIPYNFYNNFIIYSGYELSQTWVFSRNLIN